MSKDVNKYSTGLTGEPFLFNESRLLADLLTKGEEIETLHKRNLSENLIMHKKIGSLRKVTSPIFRRLSIMSATAMQILAHDDIASAKLILLVAVAKSDRLVRDFLINVYADKLALKSSKIDRSDIERYFESVYIEEPYLRDRTEQTKAKLKQQLMKILAEAGLVKKQGSVFLVIRPSITNKLANQLVADGDSEYIKVIGGSL
ncbi:hypothetical protein AUK57_00765 [Candidatus Saccharibacteria bacterium CG2_30_41_52]|nr:MAG: hypothetical protein AUK57_00765 [Candidatus Saccharibacteria bacterium CG2_30_41_52]